MTAWLLKQILIVLLQAQRTATQMDLTLLQTQLLNNLLNKFLYQFLNKLVNQFLYQFLNKLLKQLLFEFLNKFMNRLLN